MSVTKILLRLLIPAYAAAFCLTALAIGAEKVVMPYWCKGDFKKCVAAGWKPPPGVLTPDKYAGPGPGTEPDGVTKHVPRPLEPHKFIYQSPGEYDADRLYCGGVECGSKRPMPAEVRAQVELIQNGDTSKQMADAVAALGAMLKQADLAVPFLIYTAAVTPNDDVRLAANEAVKNIGITPENAKVAAKALGSAAIAGNNRRERCFAAIELQKLGCDAVPAIDNLRYSMNYLAESDELYFMLLAEESICKKCNCPWTSLGNSGDVAFAKLLQKEGSLKCPEF